MPISPITDSIQNWQAQYVVVPLIRQIHPIHIVPTTQFHFSQSSVTQPPLWLHLNTPPKPSPEKKKLCLDFANGKCKRIHCKYAHPKDLEINNQQNTVGYNQDTNKEVCKVWMHTGFCKFRGDCKYAHPRLDRNQTEFEFPSTAKYENQQKKQQTKKIPQQKENLKPNVLQVKGSKNTVTIAESSVELEESSTKSEANKAQMKRNVVGILNRLSDEKFEPLVCQLLSFKNIPIVCLMELVFQQAIAQPLHSDMYARLCKELSRRLSISLDMELMECVTNVFDSQDSLDKSKKMGSLKFLGELGNHNVVTNEQVLYILKVLVEESHGINKDFHIELACQLLTYGSENLSYHYPKELYEYVVELQNVARSSCFRIQTLVLNVIQKQKLVR